jgi:hypothetical protein
MNLQYADLLPPMLKDGVKVMIYAGEKDLICNWLGNRRWVDALPWEGASDWKNAKDFVWNVGKEDAAKVRESGGLTFVKVFRAGHMVRFPFQTEDACYAACLDRLQDIAKQTTREKLHGEDGHFRQHAWIGQRCFASCACASLTLVVFLDQ